MRVGEEQLVEPLVGQAVRAVLVRLPPLVDHHAALHARASPVEHGQEEAHAVALQPERQLDGVRGNDLVVVGAVQPGGAVVGAAHRLQQPVELALGAVLASPRRGGAPGGAPGRCAPGARRWSPRGTSGGPRRWARSGPRAPPPAVRWPAGGLSRGTFSGARPVVDHALLLSHPRVGEHRRRGAGGAANLTPLLRRRLAGRAWSVHLERTMPVPDVTPDLPPRTWRAILALLGRLPAGGAEPRLRPRRRRAAAPAAAPPGAGRLRARGRASTSPRPSTPPRGVRDAERLLRAAPAARGCARWPRDPAVLGSPVDGVAGPARGRARTAGSCRRRAAGTRRRELLGDEEDGAALRGRLLPHALPQPPALPPHPRAVRPGTIARARHVPGALLPVNAAGGGARPGPLRPQRAPGLLPGRRRRAASRWWRSAPTTSAASPPPSTPPGTRRRARRLGHQPPRRRRRASTATTPRWRWAQGEEIMAFHLGSTVVLLLEPDAPPLRPDLRPGDPVMLGQAVTE